MTGVQTCALPISASQSSEKLQRRFAGSVSKFPNYPQSWDGAGKSQSPSPRNHPGLGNPDSMSQHYLASRPTSRPSSRFAPHSPPGRQNITLPPMQVRPDTQEAAAGSSPSHLELARPPPQNSQELTVEASMILFDSGPADKDAYFDFDSFQGPPVDLAQRRRIQSQISQRNYRKYCHYIRSERVTNFGQGKSSKEGLKEWRDGQNRPQYPHHLHLFPLLFQLKAI